MKGHRHTFGSEFLRDLDANYTFNLAIGKTTGDQAITA
jgi:hypothetical protein